VSRAEFLRRCDVIEDAYEFMLAYAAQGVAGTEGTASTGQIRDFLARARSALTGLADVLVSVVDAEQFEQAALYRDFAAVLDRDARASLAAVDLVLAQPTISSQLVDNLNASVHVRALLTDLFLVDEILKG
jgi:hypothetical protein